MIGAREVFTSQRPLARLGPHPIFIEKNGQSLGEIWDLLVEYRLGVIFEGEAMTREWFTSH